MPTYERGSVNERRLQEGLQLEISSRDARRLTATLPPGDKSPRFPMLITYWERRKDSFGMLNCNGQLGVCFDLGWSVIGRCLWRYVYISRLTVIEPWPNDLALNVSLEDSCSRPRLRRLLMIYSGD